MLYFTFTEFAPLTVLTIALVFLSRAKPNRQQRHAVGQVVDDQIKFSGKETQKHKSSSEQFYFKDGSGSVNAEDDILPGGSHSDEITSPFLTDREGGLTDVSYASSSTQYVGNFRTNTYEYCIGTGDESGAYRASDSSRAPLRYHGGYAGLRSTTGGVDGTHSSATSTNSMRHDDITAVYESNAGLKPSIHR